MSTGTFDIGVCFKKAFDVYKKNLGLLIAASFVASLLISLTVGILTGPILAGLMVLVLKLVDGKDDAAFSNLFESFDSFVTTFLICLAWGVAFYIIAMVLNVIPILGFVAVLVLSGAFSVFLSFAIIQVVEKKESFQAASKSAFELLKKDLWMLVAYGILASLASSVGALACGFGVIVTLPIYYVLMAVAYRQCTAGAPAEAVQDIPVVAEVKEEAEPVVEEAPVTTEAEAKEAEPVVEKAPAEIAELPEEEPPVEPKAE